MSELKRLIEERNRISGEIRGILEQAKKENNGLLSAEQDQKVKELEAQDCRTFERIGLEERQIEREKALKKVVDGDEPITTQGENRGSEDKKESEKRMKMFKRWLVDPSALHHPEFRDLSAGSMTAGGSFIAPQQFVADLIKAVDNVVFVKKYATVIPMQKAVSLGVPTLDSNPDDADWTTELATGSADSGMKTGKRELSPFPLAKRLKLSNKLLQVSAIPIEELVRDRLAYKFGVAQEKAFLTGDGAEKPLGVFTASAKGVSTSRDASTGNTTTEVRFDGLIEALYTLKAQYQAKAVWMFHRDAVKMLRKLKDGEGRYIWQASQQAGEPDTLLGKPFLMSEYAPNTFSTGKYVGAVGDWSTYWIAQVLDLSLQRLNELYAETNQVGWIGRMELDGMPVIEEAFARVTLA